MSTMLVLFYLFCDGKTEDNLSQMFNMFDMDGNKVHSGLPPGFQRIPILQYKCRVSCKISIYQNIWKIPIQSRGLSPENVIKIKSFMQIPIHIRCEL